MEQKMSFSDKYILVLNTAVNHYIGTAIFKIQADELLLVKKSWRKVKYKQSENLLLFLDKILVKAKIKADDLSAVLVVSGPGSFTAVRIGVAVANTWGLVQNIQVFDYVMGNKGLLEKKDWDRQDWSFLLDDISIYLKKTKVLKQIKNDNGKDFKPVLPVYNGKVKIG